MCACIVCVCIYTVYIYIDGIASAFSVPELLLLLLQKRERLLRYARKSRARCIYSTAVRRATGLDPILVPSEAFSLSLFLLLFRSIPWRRRGSLLRERKREDRREKNEGREERRYIYIYIIRYKRALVPIPRTTLFLCCTALPAVMRQTAWYGFSGWFLVCFAECWRCSCAYVF